MANNGRFIFDIVNWKNHSFEKGTLGSLPTSWTKLGNGNDASTLKKSSAVAALSISGPGAGTFIGEIALLGTDTEVFAVQTANPNVELNKEYIAVVYLRTAGGTGAGRIGLAGVDDGGTVHDTEATQSFTGAIVASAWTKIELKKTFTNASTTRGRVRIYHTDGSNVLYIDHTFLGKVLDMKPGGSEPDKLLNDYDDPKETFFSESKSEQAFELMKVADPEFDVKIAVDHVYKTMGIHDRFVDMLENHLNQGEHAAFWFDKDNPADRHFIIAGGRKQRFKRPRGVSLIRIEETLSGLPWTGWF